MTFFEQVYEVVKRIPAGKVATYGQIAALLGNVRRSRAVGYALHVNPDPDGTPCYRVVNREGRLAPAFAFGGPEIQAELLRRSGVEVTDGYVDLARFLWHPGEEDGPAGNTFHG